MYLVCIGLYTTNTVQPIRCCPTDVQYNQFADVFQYNQLADVPVQRTLVQWSIFRGEIVITIDYIMLVLTIDYIPAECIIRMIWRSSVDFIAAKIRWCIVNSCLE